jgi:hypothetical protein
VAPSTTNEFSPGVVVEVEDVLLVLEVDEVVLVLEVDEVLLVAEVLDVAEVEPVLDVVAVVEVEEVVPVEVLAESSSFLQEMIVRSATAAAIMAMFSNVLFIV